jgi:SAM-dependent methyltransferase
MAHATLYMLSQRLMGKETLYDHLVRALIRPQPHSSIVDIGCGTGDLLGFLPDVTYLGFDRDSRRVAAARERFGRRGEFRVADLDQVDLDGRPPADVAVAIGVIHHLDDLGADNLCKLATRILKPSGRLVTLDPAIVPRRSMVDRILTAAEPGRHVRTPSAYRALIERHFMHLRESIRSDLLRIRQTLVMFEADSF